MEKEFHCGLLRFYKSRKIPDDISNNVSKHTLHHTTNYLIVYNYHFLVQPFRLYISINKQDIIAATIMIKLLLILNNNILFCVYCIFFSYILTWRLLIFRQNISVSTLLKNKIFLFDYKFFVNMYFFYSKTGYFNFRKLISSSKRSIEINNCRQYSFPSSNRQRKLSIISNLLRSWLSDVASY